MLDAVVVTGYQTVERRKLTAAVSKLDKMCIRDSNCIKAWRAIGWCSFVNGKYEQAMKYYEKILASKPLAADYLNAGHVA